MGGAGDAGMVVQRLIAGWLVGIDVQTGGADFTGVQGLQQIVLVDVPSRELVWRSWISSRDLGSKSRF